MRATIKYSPYTEKHIHFQIWISGWTRRVFTCSIQKTYNLVLMKTVEENMRVFTKCDAEGAKSSRKLYAKLLYMSNPDFKWSIKNNQIKNCEVSVWNIDTAQEIWGKDISVLKGKTVWGKPTMVASDRIKIPKEIANLKKTVFLTADILFVNGIPLFISLRRKIDFTGVRHLKVRTAAIIFDAFRAIFRFYLQRGFRIQTVHADGEFRALKYLIQNMLEGTRVNLTIANEYVP